MSSTYPENGLGEPSRQDPAGEVAQAREKLGEAGEAIRSEAAHFADKAREQVTEQVQTQTEAVSGALEVFAEAVRKAGEELGRQDQGFAANLAGQAAEGLQSLSRTLAVKSPEDMLHAARDFGRNNPTAFLACAVLAGVAVGRFTRSSGAQPPAPSNLETSWPQSDFQASEAGGDGRDTDAFRPET